VASALALQATSLQDGAGQKAVYSLRTLSRALEYCRSALPVYGLQRSLYDGFAMAFLTQLAADSAARLEALLRSHLLGAAANLKVRAAVCHGGRRGRLACRVCVHAMAHLRAVSSHAVSLREQPRCGPSKLAGAAHACGTSAPP
jgi:Midasin AAA lid domain